MKSARLALALALLAGRAKAQGITPPPVDTLGVRAEPVRRLVSEGRWQDALAALGAPRDSAGRALASRLAVNAGVVALRSRDSALAAADWERAMAAGFAPIEAYQDLGALLLATGRPDSARRVVIRGLGLARSDARLLALRAATIRDTTDLRTVLAAVELAHRESPGDAALTLDLAGLVASGDARRAAALYDSLLCAPAPAVEAYEAATGFWEGTGGYDRASAVADSALIRYPRSGTLWLLSARASAGRRDWRSAMTADRRAAGLLADPSPAELALMDAAVSAGDTATAGAVLGWMTRGDRPRAALLAAARRARRWGLIAAAESAYVVILARHSHDATALTGLAGVLLSRGDTVRALGVYRAALADDSAGPIPPLQVLRLSHLPPDSGRSLLLLAEWRGIAALERLSLAPERPAGADDPRAEVDSVVRLVLDTVVLRTEWGPEELSHLMVAHPHQPLLERYAALLAVQGNDDSLALVRYDELLRQRPADAELQRGRAEVLERMGRAAEARDAFGRVLDLQPDDSVAFRALVRLDEPTRQLGDLLDQIRRIRLRLPKSRTLTEREVEVLQRLGRLSEAQAVARELEVGHS